MWQAAMNFVSGIFKPAADLIDNVHTSDEEKLVLRNAMAKLQNEVTVKQIDLLSKQMDLEKQLLEAQSSIINTESKSESWIARSWRPITMLTFLVIIVCHSLGLITLQQEFADKFMTLVQIGL
ncbi:MAG: hypothetical protein BBJ57_06440, partial [Desulfobacterales bacterium PC51MH44]